jgi:hypothetical protein
MLSTKTRLRVEFVCKRIESRAPVELSDMTWVQKWAVSNRTVHDMLQNARRRAVSNDKHGWDLCDEMNLGDPDPSTHVTKDSSVDDLANFFKAPDWMRRD